MPDGTGLELLQECRGIQPGCKIRDFKRLQGSLNNAEALGLGALISSKTGRFFSAHCYFSQAAIPSIQLGSEPEFTGGTAEKDNFFII